jgi:hypothetical protein
MDVGESDDDALVGRYIDTCNSGHVNLLRAARPVPEGSAEPGFFQHDRLGSASGT